MRLLSYVSFVVIWISLCALCTIGVYAFLGLPGNKAIDMNDAGLIGAGVGTVISVPLGYLMLTGQRMRRKRALGPVWVCKVCGYDLRGAIGATECPECGTELTEARRSMLRVMHEREINTDAKPQLFKKLLGRN